MSPRFASGVERTAAGDALAPADPKLAGIEPLPRRLAAFIWRVSARQQIGLALLSALVFSITVLPLEIQRRIVNDAFVGGDAHSIILLALAYLGAAVTLGALKLGLNVYRRAGRAGATPMCSARPATAPSGPLP